MLYPTHVTPSYVCMPNFRPVAPCNFLDKILFFWLILKKGRDVTIWTCLKHSTGHIDFKYIWVHWSNSTCPSMNQGHKQANRLYDLYSIDIYREF